MASQEINREGGGNRRLDMHSAFPDSHITERPLACGPDKRLASALLLAVVFLLVAAGLGGSQASAAQKDAAPGYYTQKQADAGRAAVADTCGKCHASDLRGRIGDSGELPPYRLLPESYRKVLEEKSTGVVPPLAGEEFFRKWRGKTTAEFVARIVNAGGAFPPYGKDDTAVFLRVAAYILQMNGVASGPKELTEDSSKIL